MKKINKYFLWIFDENDYKRKYRILLYIFLITFPIYIALILFKIILVNYLPVCIFTYKIFLIIFGIVLTYRISKYLKYNYPVLYEENTIDFSSFQKVNFLDKNAINNIFSKNYSKDNKLTRTLRENKPEYLKEYKLTIILIIICFALFMFSVFISMHLIDIGIM